MYFKETLIFHSGNGANYRIPSVIATNKGTLIAVCNDRRNSLSDSCAEVTITLCRKEADGEWSEVKLLQGKENFCCGIGNAIYDAELDNIIVFGGYGAIPREEFKEYTKEEIEEHDRKVREMAEAAGIKLGSYLIESKDDGNTWTETPYKVNPVKQIHTDGTEHTVSGGTHGAAHGIQLKNGQYKGRLISASRTQIGKYSTIDGLKEHVYNNAIYSDDHGKTWKTANCVQVGTGEGTLIENADGTLTYNSRAYFKDGKRRIATSTDGGATWGNFRNDDFLEEEAFCGCNASFLRVALEDIKDKSILPEGAKDVTVFCNPRAKTRDNMCACVSFDSGNTWSKVKVINPGHAAYSSLEWNPVTQKFCLLYETGEKHPYSDGITAAEFDMEWLLSE